MPKVVIFRDTPNELTFEGTFEECRQIFTEHLQDARSLCEGKQLQLQLFQPGLPEFVTVQPSDQDTQSSIGHTSCTGYSSPSAVQSEQGIGDISSTSLLWAASSGLRAGAALLAPDAGAARPGACEDPEPQVALRSKEDQHDGPDAAEASTGQGGKQQALDGLAGDARAHDGGSGSWASCLPPSSQPRRENSDGFQEEEEASATLSTTGWSTTWQEWLPSHRSYICQELKEGGSGPSIFGISGTEHVWF
jgi:hypothetical protein